MKILPLFFLSFLLIVSGSQKGCWKKDGKGETLINYNVQLLKESPLYSLPEGQWYKKRKVYLINTSDIPTGEKQLIRTDSFSKDGLLIKIRPEDDPIILRKKYRYDEHGRIKREEVFGRDEFYQKQTFAYSTSGALRQSFKEADPAFAYYYRSKDGILIERTVSDESPTPISESISYKYSPSGVFVETLTKLKGVPMSRSTYKYDGRGRLKLVETYIDGFLSYALRFTYDDEGLPIIMQKEDFERGKLKLTRTFEMEYVNE